MITSSEMAAMRAAQEATMTDQAQISRRTLTSDGMGGHTESWSSSGSAIACRVGSGGRTAEERRIAERIGAVMTYVVSLPAGTEINESDRLVVTPSILSNASGSRNLEVVGMLRESLGTCTRVMCVEVR